MLPETDVNDGPEMQTALEFELAYTENVNGPRVSVSFSGRPAIGECDLQSSFAAASCCGEGKVGDGVQPANAFEAPAPSETTATTAPAVPAAPASALIASGGRTRRVRGR